MTGTGDRGHRPVPAAGAPPISVADPTGVLWLLASPGHPDADDIRKRADDFRTWWLRHCRDVLGFAYLTLVVPT